jgi:hypothetical protein
MNKIINYAILIYTILSGIIATLYAIDYFIIAPVIGGEITSYYTYAMSGMGLILNSPNLNTTEQIAILDKLFNQTQTLSIIADNYVLNSSFSQFIEYESIFIIPPAILLGIIYYKAKKEDYDNWKIY